MPMFHSVHSIQDEEKLLKKIIDLETEIRAKEEKKRVNKIGQHETFSKIFEPITKELKTISEVTQPTSIPDPVPVKNEPDGRQSPERSPPISPQKYSQPYTAALNAVSADNLEDGLFGLNPLEKVISGYRYHIEGNSIVVHGTEGYQDVKVVNPVTWLILLSKNPAKICDLKNAAGDYTDAAKEFIHIGKHFNFVDNAKLTDKKGYERRTKYSMLTGGHGSGFLFSVRAPPVNKFLPSDPQGVLRELQKSLAEYRAGNKSMRNIIVPLYQQAKRMKILPKNLLSEKEFSWIYT